MISQDAVASLVAGAVQRALVQHDANMNAPTLISASRIAGSVAAAVTFLPPTHQRAIEAMQGELAGLASEFVHALAAEAARRSATAAAGIDENPALMPANDTRRPTPQNLRNRADDLESMLIEDWAGRVAGSTYLEENFRIPRSTLHRWQRRNEVIALRKGGRKHDEIVKGLKVTAEVDYLHLGEDTVTNFTKADKENSIGSILRFQRSF